MHDLVCRPRDNVFFGKHFDAISDKLQKSEWPDSIRAKTVLETTKTFSFQDRGDAKKAGERSNEAKKSTSNQSGVHIFAGAGCGGAAVLGAGGAAFFAFSAARFASTAAASVGCSL